MSSIASELPVYKMGTSCEKRGLQKRCREFDLRACHSWWWCSHEEHVWASAGRRLPKEVSRISPQAPWNSLLKWSLCQMKMPPEGQYLSSNLLAGRYFSVLSVRYQGMPFAARMSAPNFKMKKPFLWWLMRCPLTGQGRTMLRRALWLRQPAQ